MHGSLHISANTCNIDTMLDVLLQEYSNPKSYINQDPTHNDFLTSFIIYDDDLISIYDGSFCTYGGGIPVDAEKISLITHTTLFGISKANGDAIQFCLFEDGKSLFEAERFSEDSVKTWLMQIDIPLFIKTMKLSFPDEQVTAIFSSSNMNRFSESFRSLFNRPIFMHVLDGDPIYPEYLDLVYTSNNLRVLKRKKAFKWDEYGDILE